MRHDLSASVTTTRLRDPATAEPSREARMSLTPVPRRCRRAVAALALLAVVAGCEWSNPLEEKSEAAAGPVVPVTSAGPTKSAPSAAACLQPAERAKGIRFHSGSGVDLAGVVLGNGPTGVVLVHQADSDLCQMVPYGRALVGLGYRVIAFDLNGNGASPAAASGPAEPHLDLDVAAAVGVLRGQGVGKIALVGASLGGLAAITAATEIRPPVAAVVSLSNPAELSGMDATRSAKQLLVPSLFVVAGEDAAARDVRAVYDATKASDRHLEEVAGSGHGIALLDETAEADASYLRALIQKFLYDHATGP
jgi:dienelactone hydrolase